MKTHCEDIEEIAKLTAELRRKIQEIPRSQTTTLQTGLIINVEHSILRFQRDLCELAQAFDIEITKEFWFPGRVK